MTRSKSRLATLDSGAKWTPPRGGGGGGGGARRRSCAAAVPLLDGDVPPFLTDPVVVPLLFRKEEPLEDRGRGGRQTLLLDCCGVGGRDLDCRCCFSSGSAFFLVGGGGTSFSPEPSNLSFFGDAATCCFVEGSNVGVVFPIFVQERF